LNKPAAGAFSSFFVISTLFITTFFSPALLHSQETLLDVPFYPQQVYQCGPSAMASVMSYWDRPRSPETIAAEMFSEAARGSLTLDMYIYAIENGFEAKQGGADIAEIKRLLDTGEPVIVLVDNGFWIVRRGHYLVVVGYRDDGFFVHNGYRKNTFISFEDFEKRWRRTGYWALIMHPESVFRGQSSGGGKIN